MIKRSRRGGCTGVSRQKAEEEKKNSFRKSRPPVQFLIKSEEVDAGRITRHSKRLGIWSRTLCQLHLLCGSFHLFHATAFQTPHPWFRFRCPWRARCTTLSTAYQLSTYSPLLFTFNSSSPSSFTILGILSPKGKGAKRMKYQTNLRKCSFQILPTQMKYQTNLRNCPFQNSLQHC